MKITKAFLFTHLAITGVALSRNLRVLWMDRNQTGKKTKNNRVTILQHQWPPHGPLLAKQQRRYGMAARKTLIANIREEVVTNDGSSLLLSGGGPSTPAFQESESTERWPDFRGMNMLKYDAHGLGNHEFDNRAFWYWKTKDGPVFLSYLPTILDRENRQPLFERRTKIFQVMTLKIAVWANHRTKLRNLGNPEFLEGIRIESTD